MIPLSVFERLQWRVICLSSSDDLLDRMAGRLVGMADGVVTIQIADKNEVTFDPELVATVSHGPGIDAQYARAEQRAIERESKAVGGCGDPTCELCHRPTPAFTAEELVELTGSVVLDREQGED